MDSGGDVDAADAGPCLGTLDGVANTWGLRCPGAASTGPDSGFPCEFADGGATVLTNSCGGLTVLGFYWGTHAQYCFYPGDGGTLVGATANDDVSTFCGFTSSTISAGAARQELGPGGSGWTWSASGQSCDVWSTAARFDCTPDAGNRVPVNHRPSDAQCQTQPAAGDCAGHVADAGPVCAVDSQCTSGDNGRCVLGGGGFAHSCSCTYDACSHDTDCSAGNTCACHGSPYTGDSNNTCVAGNCRVDADCGQAGYCSPSSTLGQCGFSVAGYYCHTSADTCVDDADCTQSACGTSPGMPTCVYSSSAGHWACTCVAVCG